MNSWKKLFQVKRVLALLLAVVLTVPSIPISTYAAPEDTVAVDTVAVETTQEAEEVSVAEETSIEVSSVAEEEPVVKQGEETDVFEGESVAASEETPVEETFAEIKIDEDELSYAAEENYGFDYDDDTNTIIAEYTEGQENVFGSMLNSIKSSSIIVWVEVEDGSDTELESQLSYKWQSKNTDGTYADMASGAVPAAVGEYKLVISLDQKFGKSEPVEINFEIVKSVLTVDADTFNVYKKSGITVKEVKDDLTEALVIRGANSTALDWNTYVKACTITVRETAGTEALADETVLKMGGDYSIDVTVELADAFTAGYDLEQIDVINVRINELQETKLSITTAVIENEKDITRVYNGNPVAEPTVTAAEGTEPEITVEVTVVGEIDETTGEDKVLEVAYDSLIKTWYDADKNALEAAPTDAGVYYFELKYTDAEGIYEESSADVKVVVEPKTIVLKPETSVTEFFVGNTATDVTSNVVYTLVNTDESAFENWDKETFWGISYNNPDKPQSYAPVFKLQMGTTPKAEEGKEAVTVWSDVTGEIVTPTGTDKEGTKTEYRIVFAGTKGLYKVYGVATDVINANDTSVNSADKNHVVDISTETLEKNAVAVTVNASANATIDTTAMLTEVLSAEEVSEKTFGDKIKLYSKIFDGNAFYADRAAYKKAVVKDAEGNDIGVKDTADELTYTWYELNINEYTDENGNILYEAIPSYNIHDYTLYNDLPSDAGLYALEVSYNDPEHKYVAANAYVYFEIEKQLIKVIPEGTPEVYEGTTIYTYVNGDADDIAYKVYKVPGNDVTVANEKLVEIPEWSSEAYWSTPYYGRDYELDWFVLKGDNIDKNVAKYTKVIDEYDEEFMLQLPYKLGVELDFDGWYDNNYADNYEVTVEEKTVTECTCDTLDITVKPEPENEINISFDSSKLTKEMMEKVYDGNPLDISAAIANGFVVVTDKKTGEEIPVAGEGALELNYRWSYEYYNEDYDDWYSRYTSEAVNAYAYTLYVSYAGNDTYKPASASYDENFVINPRKLTVTPVLSETIAAGWKMDESPRRQMVVDQSKAVIEGFIPEDAQVFAYTDSINEVLAFEDEPSVYVSYGNEDYFWGYLRTGKEYRVRYEDIYLFDNVLKDRYAGNYEVVYDSVKFQPNKRGNSTVSTLNVEGDLHSQITYGDLTVGIKPLEGISYYYADSDEIITDINGNEFAPGNYLGVEVEMPNEFNAESSYSVIEDAVYKNSVENAGGVIVNQYNDSFIAVFNAAAPESGDNTRKFEVVWEKGYTESFTIDLTNAELESDLRTAVVPKKLSFNGVDGKMIVGENQQLDVKFTKYLIDDVISLNYAVVTGEDVVSITDTGYVTALKKGTATVEVYPVKYDNKGNEIRLDFKKVTAKITVSDVAAPKTNKVSAYDYWAEVSYTLPSNGYRREMYVLEGKGWKPTDFETKIKASNQGSFEGIKIECVDEDYVYKNKVTTWVEGLKPNTDYTVYVRNVSGIRTNAQDGFVVSSSAGSVKNFKTTKVQVRELDLYADNTQPIKWNDDEDRYEVELAKKSVKLSTRGWFEYKPENAAADAEDEKGYTLPLTTQGQLDAYVNPKLSYYAVSNSNWSYEKTDSYTLKVGDRYYAPSNIAKVDKKGTVKLNGTGWVTIIVYDSISKVVSDPYRLYVTSPINKITAKKVTLKVAEPAYIWKYLTIFDGNKKIKGININENIIKMELVSGEGVFVAGNFLYATQANKSAVVKVSLIDNPEVFVNVNVKTKAMNPVKSLKATNVMDSSTTLTFTHNAYIWNPYINNDMYYKVEIKDGRNALVSLKLVNIKDLAINLDKSNFAKNVYAYSYDIDNLVRKSNYKISVTPVYGTETAKAATVKVKTTEIPAYTGDLLAKDEYGGMDVYYEPSDMSIYMGYFTSGKMYTFIAYKNRPEDYRPTDTLTWKSSNSKVGKIKVNSDNMTATFTALKPGYTIIEVSSKIRKGVIARYPVFVKAVGAAGGTEFGDYEIYDFDPYYTKSVEVLTEANPVRVNTDYWDYTWVKFTAPADGQYTFNQSDGYRWNYCYKYVPNAEEKYQRINNKYGDSVELKEGETVYRKANGSFTMTVTAQKYSKLTTINTVNSKDSTYVVFTAPEDNYYTFSATMPDQQVEYQIKYANGNTSGTYSMYLENVNNTESSTGIKLNKGDKITFTLVTDDNYDISVSYRKASSVITNTAADTGEIKAGEEKWFVFNADVAGSYEFNLTEATEGIKASFYRGGLADAGIGVDFTEVIKETAADTKDYVYNTNLNKDATVAVKVYLEANAETPTSGSAKISVSMPTVDAVVLGTEKEITVAKNSETWVSFVADEDDAKYLFNVIGEGVAVAYYKNSVTGSRVYLTKDAYNAVKKGDVIYIKLTNNSDAEAKVKVLVTKASATEIKLNDVKDLTVENDKEYVYTFTAPAYGLYVFKSDVTVNAEGGTHSLEAKKYYNVNALDSYAWADQNPYSTNDFYKEVVLGAGDKVIFAVKATSEAFDTEGKPATTAAKISVSQMTATDLPAEITLDKDSEGEVKWYRFTAKTDDTYNVKSEYKDGENYVAGLNGLANVNYAFSLSPYTNNMPSQLTLSAGQSVYFKVVSNNTDKENAVNIKITVSATESLVEEIPASAFDVASGETKTYKYTVTKAGRYKVSFKSATEGVNPTVTKADSYNGYYYSVDNNDEYVFDTIGKTYYFKVTTDNADAEKKASVSLKITEVTAAEIKAETTTVTVESGDAQWLVYTVPANGRYEFKATTGENDETYSNVSYYDELTDNYTSGNLSENWLDKGRTVYVKIYNNGAEDVTVKFTAKAIAMEDITAGTAKAIILKNGETKWYKFTADETTYYSLVQALAEEMDVNAYYYKNTSNGYSWLSSNECMKFEKNDSLYIKVTRNDSADVESLTDTFTISKVDVLNLEPGKELTITTKNEEVKYVRFVAPKDAYYAFGVKDVLEEVSVSDSYGIGNYTVEYYNITDEVIFTIGANFEVTEETKDSEKSFKLYAEEIIPAALTTDGADVTVAKYQRAWFTFEAPEDGIYNFTAESTNENVRYGIYTDNDYYYPYGGSGEMPYEEVRMAEGETLTMAVYYYDNKADKSEEKVADNANFKLKVTKTEMKPMAAEGTTVELEADTYAWYSYTAAKTGEYTFACENGSMTIYKSLLDNSTVSTSSLLVAGDTVYIRLSNNTSEKASVKVTVATVEAITLTMDNVVQVSFTAEEIESGITYKWLAFTANKSGLYKFTKETVEGDMEAWYDGTETLDEQYVIEKDNTVYIKVSADAAASVKISVDYNELPSGMTMVGLNTASSVSVDQGEYVWYAFTAPSTGNYRFKASEGNDSDIWFFEDINDVLTVYSGADRNMLDEYCDAHNDGVSSTGWSFSYSYPLQKGQTIYFAVGSYSLSYSIDYTFTVTKE